MINQIKFTEEQYCVIEHVFKRNIRNDMQELKDRIEINTTYFENQSLLNSSFVIRYLTQAINALPKYPYYTSYIIGHNNDETDNKWRILPLENLDQLELLPGSFKHWFTTNSYIIGSSIDTDKTSLLIISYLIYRENATEGNAFRDAIIQVRAADGGFLTTTLKNEAQYLTRYPKKRPASNDKKEQQNTSQSSDIKENNKMKNVFEFDFGPVDDSMIKMSPFGIAIQNVEKKWVTYDVKNKTIVEVDNFCFNFGKAMMKVPVPISEVKAGNVIMHNKKPVFVLEIQDKNISVVDLAAGENKIVIPSINMFGFNFVTKIVSFINIPQANPNDNQPFGNIIPYLMINSIMGGNDQNDKDVFGGDVIKFMMLSSMMGGQNIFTNMFNGVPAPLYTQDVKPVNVDQSAVQCAN